MLLYFFFFFKQKTAYEMLISDWSSDVCSSYLTIPLNEIIESIETRIVDVPLKKVHNHSSASHAHQSLVFLTLRTASGVVAYGEEIGRASCRERVCQYV